KVITSCRPGVFANKEKTVLFESIIQSPETKPYEEIHLQYFTQAQIQEYLKNSINSTASEQLEKLKHPQWSKLELENWQLFWKWLEEIPDLLALAKTPNLLKLIIESLPNLVEKIKSEKISPQNVSITQNMLFKKFTEQCFINEAEKLKKMDIDIEKDNLCKYLKAYTQNLAILLLDNNGQINERYLTGEETLNVDLLEPNNDKELLNIYIEKHKQLFNEKKMEKIRNASFLRAITCLNKTYFEFTHKSLIEFFIADEMYTTLLKYKFHLLGSEINKRSAVIIKRSLLALKAEEEILQNLTELVHQDQNFNKLLWDLIKKSQTIPGVDIIAASAITILNKANIPFSHKNLSDIQIPGADLSNSICFKTDFRNANLKDVNFNNAYLVASKWSGANVTGINFVNHINIDFKRKITAILPYENLNKKQFWFIAVGNCILHCDLVGEILDKYYLDNFFSPNPIITCLAINPRNNTFAFGTDEGFIYVMAWNEKKILRTFNTLNEEQKLSHSLSKDINKLTKERKEIILSNKKISHLAFTQEGDSIISFGQYCGGILLWNFNTGHAENIVKEYSLNIASFAATSFGRYIAWYNNGTEHINLYDLILRCPLQISIQNKSDINSMMFDPSGLCLALAKANGNLQILFLSNSTEKLVIEEPENNKNYKSSEKNIPDPISWQLKSLDKLQPKRITLNTGTIICLAFNPKLQWLATAGVDGIIKLWQIPSGIPGHILTDVSKKITQLFFSSSGENLAFFSNKKMHVKKIPVLDFSFPEITSEIQEVNCIATCSKKIALSNLNGKILLLNSDTGKIESIIRKAGPKIISLAFRPCSKNLIILDSEGIITCFNLTSKKENAINNLTSKIVASNIFFTTNDNTAILFDSWSSSVKELDLARNHIKAINYLNFHIKKISAIAFNSENNLLVIGGITDFQSNKNAVLFYRLGDLNHIYYLLEDDSNIKPNYICFDSSSDWVAIAGEDFNIRLYQITFNKHPISKTRFKNLESHTYPIVGMAFHPQGEWLVSCAQNGVIIIWSHKTGKSLQKFTLGFGVEYISLQSNNCLIIKGGNNYLACVDLSVPNKYKLKWLFRNVYALNMKYLNITQAIGLTEPLQQISKQHGAICDNDLPSINRYQAICTLIKPIRGTGATTDDPHRSLIKINQINSLLDENNWAVSVVHSKNEALHTFLIIEGILNQRRFIISGEIRVIKNN
ncbi:MAG: pentapeptide repeat-containing protein, partial [Gammaproteobacteria bacterium]